jgi:hypothetical protein
MRRTTIAAAAIVCAVGVAIGCGRNSNTPAAPSAVPEGATEATPDGVGLKATAPTPQSPINNVKPTTPSVVLVVGNASLKFTSGLPLQYQFEVYNASGTLVHQSGLVAGGSGGTTSYEVPIFLEADKTYRWQSRALYSGMGGPWCAQATFVAPQTGGYIRAGEIYDPLNNGKTVGNVTGPVGFSAKGITLQELTSNVSYRLPSTMTSGEYSLLVTDMPANTKGGKTKVLSMSQGYDDIITNDRRYTWEKRGDPPGVIAYRVLTHDDRIETEGAERVAYNFAANETYFWRTTWGNHRLTWTIRAGGANGPIIYDRSDGMVGEYNPSPHIVWIGAPIGRSGADGASVKGMTVRQLWVSTRERPGYANQ